MTGTVIFKSYVLDFIDNHADDLDISIGEFMDKAFYQSSLTPADVTKLGLFLMYDLQLDLMPEIICPRLPVPEDIKALSQRDFEYIRDEYLGIWLGQESDPEPYPQDDSGELIPKVLTFDGDGLFTSDYVTNRNAVVAMLDIKLKPNQKVGDWFIFGKRYPCKIVTESSAICLRDVAIMAYDKEGNSSAFQKSIVQEKLIAWYQEQMRATKVMEAEYEGVCQ